MAEDHNKIINNTVRGECMPKLKFKFESEPYPMNFKNRGKCYIFNHKVFNSDLELKVRYGTERDASRLEHTFNNLGFHTEVFNDLTVREVDEALENASKEDHTDNSCFVCCILSHGECGMIFAKDGKYPASDVFRKFLRDTCPTLNDKPKLFFIQACQGTELQKGVAVAFKESKKESTDSTSQFKTPTHPDFLIAYSSVPGFCSVRHTIYGTWFIQALCAVLEEHATKKDILQILTIVNRKIAFDFDYEIKQIPLITSTLIKDLKFF